MTAIIAGVTLRRECLKCVCDRPNCEERFEDADELQVHKSYHDYHQKIKDEGRRELDLLEKRFQMTIKCPLAESLDGCYYFPQLPTRLVCEWCECGQQFQSVENFYDHVSNHAHRLVDRCYWQGCNITMKRITAQLLREHLRVHTLQKLYACPQCGNFFSTKIKFDDHFLRHLVLPPFLQNTERNRPVTILSKKDGEHVFNIEEFNVNGSTISVFKCAYENCDKAFFSSSLLREHIRTHSNKNRCDQCAYVAKSQSRLEQHKLFRHQTERKFQCTICSKTFKQRSDLRAHVKRHQIVTPYRCDKCDFETYNEEGLNTHAKLHNTNNGYLCHICAKVFSRGNNLSRHLRLIHKLNLPDGQSRFKYIMSKAGVYLLDSAVLVLTNSRSQNSPDITETVTEVHRVELTDGHLVQL